MRRGRQVEILKSQLATEFTTSNDNRADFWEFLPVVEGADGTVGLGLVKILISQLSRKKILRVNSIYERNSHHSDLSNRSGEISHR